MLLAEVPSAPGAGVGALTVPPRVPRERMVHGFRPWAAFVPIACMHMWAACLSNAG